MRLELERRQGLALSVLAAGLFAALTYSLVLGLTLAPYVRFLVPLAFLTTLAGTTAVRRPWPVVTGLGLLTVLATGMLALPQVRPWLNLVWEGFDLLLTSAGQAGPPPHLAALEALAAGIVFIPGGLLAGWAAAWLLWRRGTALPLLLLGVLVLGAQWLWFVESAHPAMVAYWLLWVMIAALTQTGLRRAAWRQAGSRLFEPPTGLVLSVSLALAAALTVIGVALPNRFEPVSLESVSRAMVNALPSLEGLRGAAAGSSRFRFSLTRTGFARSQERLGGPVRTDDREALTLRILGDRLPATLYLRGSVDSEYTGQGWRTPEDVQGESTRGDSTKVIPGERFVTLPSTPAQVTLTVQNLRTNTIFAPTGLHRLSVPGGSYLRDSLGNLTAERPLGREETYQEQVEVAWDNAGLLARTDRVEPTNRDLAPFLRLPPALPPRVGGLAQEVTRGATNPYDQALMVEDYLRGLPYSLDVPAPPAGRDFADYFLFDLQRGYCTYSSTAMAVMLRTLGIPSRWVQGFAVPLDSGSGTYAARNSQAHAWVEAYFSGYGWVAFDPTPRFTPPARTQPAPVEEATGTGNGATGSTGTGGPGRNRGLDEEALPPGSQVQAQIPVSHEGFRPWTLLAAAFKVTSVLALLAGLGLVVLRWWRERLPAGNGKARLRAFFRNLEGLLSRFDHGRRQDQTPEEWLRALGYRWPDLKGEMQALSLAYQDTRYGLRTPAAEALNGADRLWAALRRRLLAETSWAGYLWRRFRP